MVLERIIPAGDDGMVLRNYIKREFDISYRLLKKIKANFLIRVNGSIAFTNILLRKGDLLTISIERLAHKSETISPEAIPIEIIYEDEYMIAINKQSGLIIHPSAYESGGTIANGLASYFEQSGCRSLIHPVSRLDRDTSGVILFAKDSYTADRLSRALRGGEFQKEYLGIIHGDIRPRTGCIDLPIGRVDGFIMLRDARCDGKHARTYYETLFTGNGVSVLLLNPITGRTHQIRAHLAGIGGNLLSDKLYNSARGPYGPYNNMQKDMRNYSGNYGVINNDFIFINSDFPSGYSLMELKKGSLSCDLKNSACLDYDCESVNHDKTFINEINTFNALIKRQALHSWRLTFPHPHSKRILKIIGKPPEDFRAVMEYIGYYPESQNRVFMD